MSRPLAAARWPRVYRPTGAHRALLGGLGGLLALGGAAGALWLALRQGPPGASGALPLVPAILAALGAFMVAALLRERLILHPDAIEFHELGRGIHRFRRDEITGRRVIPQQYGLEQWVLELRGLGRGLYDATPVGATVCVEVHPGALGLRWLSVDACP